MSKKRILIVDDQPEITEIVQEFIDANFDVDTDTAASAHQALEAVSKNIYNVIISDHHMPGMNGVEFLKEIRSVLGPNKDCPVIFLTAMEIEVKSEVEGRYENVQVLNKVAQIEELMNQITTYLS